MKKLLFLSAFVCSFYSSVLCAELFKAEEFFLSNGLHVVIVENHKRRWLSKCLFTKWVRLIIFPEKPAALICWSI